MYPAIPHHSVVQKAFFLLWEQKVEDANLGTSRPFNFFSFLVFSIPFYSLFPFSFLWPHHATTASTFPAALGPAACLSPLLKPAHGSLIRLHRVLSTNKSGAEHESSPWIKKSRDFEDTQPDFVWMRVEGGGKGGWGWADELLLISFKEWCCRRTDLETRDVFFVFFCLLFLKGSLSYIKPAGRQAEWLSINSKDWDTVL